MIGWRGIFLAQTVWGIMNLLLVWAFLPETLREPGTAVAAPSKHGGDNEEADDEQDDSEGGSLLQSPMAGGDRAGGEGPTAAVDLDESATAAREIDRRRLDRTVAEPLHTRIVNPQAICHCL